VGLPVSIFLIAIGAILAFAVNPSGDQPVSVHAVGWILMAVGLLGLLLTLMWWDRWGWGRRGAYVEGAPARGYGRRRTVVEDVGGPPPGPPVGPPPPGPPPGDPPPY
jgi:hypothetical protein